MLRKLLKYDLRSMLRLFLPLWAAVLLLSAVNHFTVFRLFNNFDGHGLNVSATVFLLAYVLLICAVCVISLVYIIQRFYSGLLRDEGYLMFTLPVKHWQLVTGKLLTALLLLLFSGIVGCGAVALLGGDRLPWGKISRLLSMIHWDFKDVLLLLVLFLLLVRIFITNLIKIL